MAEATRYPVTAIVAPAGFGKSVVLRQFLSSQDFWILYDVPHGADALLPFVRGLCDALAHDVPSLRASLASAVDGLRNSDSFGRELAIWLASHISSVPRKIAVDNINECIDDLDVSAFIVELQKRTRANVKWLFATRGSPTLPTASWIAYDNADLIIDSDDLRFDLNEARAVSSNASVQLADTDIVELLLLTDGWPVAFSFAIRLFAKTRNLQVLADKTRAIIFQYLAEQVWQSLEDDLRSFLMIAAYLPRIDLESIASANFNKPNELLHKLQSRVGLITRSMGVFELHDLFRDFIQSHLAAEGRTQTKLVMLQAGTVLERTGYHVEALQRYVDAESIGDVDRILTLLNFSLLESGHIDIVEIALRLLHGTDSPSAAALRASIDEARGRVSSAELLYRHALSSEKLAKSLRIGVAWRYSLLLYQQGRTDTVPLLEELCGRSDLTQSERAHILGTLAVLLAFSGEIQRAQSVVRDAIALSQNGDDQLRARTLGRASTVAFFAGDINDVERYARDAAQIAEDDSLFALSARIKTSLSALHASSGRLKLAAAFAEQVVEDAEKAGDLELRVRGLREQLVLEAEMGNEARVLDIELKLGASTYSGPNAFIAVLVARSMRLMWNSCFSETVDILSEEFRNELSSHQHLLRNSFLSIAAAAEHRVAIVHSAVAAYEIASEMNSAMEPTFVRERVLSLQYVALALLLIGERSQSRMYCRRAASLSSHHCILDGALRAIVARSTDSFRSALRELELRSSGGIARVVYSVSSSLFARELGGNIRLTNSEFDVLKAMSDGLSNKSIADRHSRTINTVRSQVSAVLRKLNCASRGEAVAIARRRQIIPQTDLHPFG